MKPLARVFVLRDGLVVRAYPYATTTRAALRSARFLREHGWRAVWIAALPDAGILPSVRRRHLGGV